MESRNIVIACGGTGGHLFPGLAVAEELQRRGHRVLIIKSEKPIDEIATRDRTEFQYATLPAIGFPGFSPKLPGFFLKLWSGYRQCRKIYGQFTPDIVLGMGGFTSAVPLYCGRKAKAGTLVHESNAVPGKANRLNAVFSDVVMLGYADCSRHFPKSRTMVTGTPVRAALKNPPGKQDARRELGLDVGYPVLLIMGGSQGAQGINHALADYVLSDQFPVKRWQVLHLAGAGNAGELARRYEERGVRGKALEFCDRMDLALAAADTIVSRSGASSLAEIAFFGLPSLLIPYPYATDDHQTRNAEIPADRGASFILEECDADPGTVGRLLSPLLSNDDQRRKMSEAAREMSPAEAEEAIADEVEALIEKRQKR